MRDEDDPDYLAFKQEEASVLGQAQALLTAMGGSLDDLDDPYNDDNDPHSTTSPEAYRRRQEEHARHMAHMTKLLEDTLSTPHTDMFEALCDQGRILDDIFRTMVMQSSDVGTLRRDDIALALKAQTSFRLAFREARVANKAKT